MQEKIRKLNKEKQEKIIRNLEKGKKRREGIKMIKLGDS